MTTNLNTKVKTSARFYPTRINLTSEIRVKIVKTVI